MAVPIPKCGCGCNKEVTIYRGTPRFYIRGHNGTGKKMTPHFRPKRGPHTEAAKLKMSLARVGRFRGSLHPNWKGGYKDENYRERRRFKTLLQRKIFERDNYTCQLCSVRGVSMQVDHIQSWSDFPDLRFNIDNCRTLCMSCHYKLTFNKSMPKNIKSWGHNFSHIRKVVN